jgi:hypothetical protein
MAYITVIRAFANKWSILYNIVTCTGYRLVNTIPLNEYARNNRVTVGNYLFYSVRANMLKERQLERPSQFCREAGSDTSTVALRTVGGGTKCGGYDRATLFLALQVGGISRLSQ